jgi:hypothetical protein
LMHGKLGPGEVEVRAMQCFPPGLFLGSRDQRRPIQLDSLAFARAREILMVISGLYVGKKALTWVWTYVISFD